MMQINWSGALPHLPRDYASQYKTGWIAGTAVDPRNSIVVLVRRDHLPEDEPPPALDPRDIVGLWDWTMQEWLFIEPDGSRKEASPKRLDSVLAEQTVGHELS